MPGVRALALALTYRAQVSLPALHTFLTDAGLDISRGQVSRLVTAGLEGFHTEQRESLAAGLASSPWQHWDATSTPVDGAAWDCHVLTNPLYTAYHTAPHQDRASVLDALRGGAPRSYRLDAAALDYMERQGVPQYVRRGLKRWPQEQEFSAAEFAQRLQEQWPRLREAVRKEVEDAALLSAYRAQREWPVVRCLVGDDAAVLRGLTEELALCWIHDGRHYARLIPEFRLHRRQLDQFLDAYWGLYRELKAYREAPNKAEAQRLEAAFDRLFSRGKLNWSDLLRCMERTRANKAKLLLVLKHPELPLHNNEAELAARKRVRKRDVSFGPRSAAGVRAWDTFQSLAETARKQGVRSWEYLVDRFSGAGQIPRLADLITARARLLDLGASWAAT
jgi:hypothetical protein